MISYKTDLLKVQRLATSISSQALYFTLLYGVCHAFINAGLCP